MKIFRVISKFCYYPVNCYNLISCEKSSHKKLKQNKTQPYFFVLFYELWGGEKITLKWEFISLYELSWKWKTNRTVHIKTVELRSVHTLNPPDIPSFWCFYITTTRTRIGNEQLLFFIFTFPCPSVVTHASLSHFSPSRSKRVQKTFNIPSAASLVSRNADIITKRQGIMENMEWHWLIIVIVRENINKTCNSIRFIWSSFLWFAHCCCCCCSYPRPLVQTGSKGYFQSQM